MKKILYDRRWENRLTKMFKNPILFALLIGSKYSEITRISKVQLITLRRKQRPLQSRAQPHTSSVYCWLAATMVLVLRGTFERRPRNDRRTSDRRQFPSSAPHSPPRDNILNKAGFERSCLRLDNNNGNFGWRFSLWLDIEPQGDTFVYRVLSSSLAAKSAGLLHSNIWLSTDPFKTAMLCCKVGIVGNLQWLHCWNSPGRKSRQSQTLGGNHVNSKRACYRVIIKDCRL